MSIKPSKDIKEASPARDVNIPLIHRYVGRIIYVMRRERGMRQSELSALTGLKQPNLSRIENGLVVPRPSTLQKVALALDVDVKDLLSEDKAREVEAKWGAAISPKNAGQIFSGKLSAVPLFSTNSGYHSAFDSSAQPAGKLELNIQLLPVEGRPFALRVADESMQAGQEGFRPGEVVVFSDKPATQSGDCALVHTSSVTIFRKVYFEHQPDGVRLVAVNPDYPEQCLSSAAVLRIWKLVRRIQEF